MSILQNIVLSQDTIKMRWQEPYITTGLNQKSVASDPRGVLAGFKVIPSVGYIVEIQTDPILGLSVANVLDTTGGKFAMTLLQPTSLFADLSAQVNSTVYLALDAQYAVGSPSGAQLKVVDAAELGVNPDLVLIARVTVPAVSPILASHINMAYRVRSGDSLATDAKPLFNLVFNSGFESDVNAAAAAGWFIDSGTVGTASTDFAKSGTKSLKLNPFVGSDTFAETAPMPVVPAEIYKVGVWARTAVGGLTGTGLQLRVKFYDKAFTLLSTVGADTPMTGVVTVFTEKKDLVTAPLLAAHAKVEVFFDATTLGTAYVDDVEFSYPRADALAHSPVFGGSSSNADQQHTHSASGSYAGSPNWADGTNIPAGTIESAIDAIPTAIGGASGAAKVGFTPVSPVDLTAVRVDLALNELDDKKAGIAIPNTFTRTNTFSTSVLNTHALISNGNGTGFGLLASGGISGGHGVAGVAIGAGFGVFGNSPGGGVKGFSTASHGVVGEAGGSGHGVFGTGGPVSGFGVLGFGGLPNGTGVSGGGVGTGFGVIGNSPGGGVKGISNANNGVEGSGFTNGVYGLGGTNNAGVYGENTNATSYGVRARASHASGTAMFAEATAGGIGVVVTSTSTGDGVRITSTNARAVAAANNSATLPTGRFANAGAGPGLVGLTNGATGSIDGVGVFGKGNISGGWFTNGATNGLALEVVGGPGDGTAIEALGIGNGYALDALNGSGGTALDVVRITGWLKMGGGSSAYPASTVGHVDRLTPKNVVKAWGTITTGPSPAVVDGFNLHATTPVVISVGTNVTVKFNASGLMANGNYCVQVTGTGQNSSYGVVNRSGTAFDIVGSSVSGGTGISNFDSVIYTIMFVVYGTQ